MQDHQIKRLLVLDQNQEKIEGVVSLGDLGINYANYAGNIVSETSKGIGNN
nr:CBS domain-containing protein [Halalkalibacillus sediminis]